MKLLSRAPKFDSNQFDSLIAKGTKISGDVSYTGSLVVEGEIEGSLMTGADPANLIVRGAITGKQITVDNLTVESTGRVTADEILVRKSLVVKKGGTVTGSILYQSINLCDGCNVNATISCSQPITK